MPKPAVLEARRIHKSYRQGPAEVRVLKGADIEVRPGEFVAVTGPSGSGKSTLLHILGLMDEPDQGEVRLFGRPARELRENERAALMNRRIGFAFQFDSLLPDFTVFENATLPGRIGLGRNGETFAAIERRAQELLARFGLAGLQHRYPSELSGGERQRTAIARSIINRPDILFADEPTGNLDKRNGELVFYNLKEVADSLGVAVVLVTHNEYAARFASRILYLSDGRLVESSLAENQTKVEKP